MIEIRNVVKTYCTGTSAEVRALKGINLAVNNGEMIAVMGVSGSGKSTLLHIIGCLDKPTEGDYILDGTNIKDCKASELYKIRNEKIGFILQDYGLIEDKTVLENVMYPLAFSKNVKFSKMKKQALQAIAQVGIDDLSRKKVSKLSGGQKQRAAAARAIVNNPGIILADEPTAALDAKTADEIMGLLKALNQGGTTVIVVTHDKRIAEMCGKTYIISDGLIEEEKK